MKTRRIRGGCRAMAAVSQVPVLLSTPISLRHSTASLGIWQAQAFADGVLQRGMKRTANGKSATDKPRLKVPDYCDIEPKKSRDGHVIWPAPPGAIEQARSFIRECAKSNSKVLLVPDKDADGLSAGVILHRTLVVLGLDASLIDVHLVQKGSNVHGEDERKLMSQHNASYVIVLDQGSRESPSITSNQRTKVLLLDHHLSDQFPEGSLVVSACHYPPVATTSLLTYEICKTLHEDVPGSTAWLACIGTHGDLGNTLKWNPPFPDMSATFKTYTKKSINDAVSLLNAPRRTSKYDVITAWTALLEANAPTEMLKNGRLQSARAEINEEVELNTHTPPKFTPDGRIAVLKINSAAQVHPVIATRWAGYLNSKSLEIVMVANYGYLPGMVNFSCRIARCAKSKDPPVNIIESLKAAADLSTDGLRDRMGDSFARGHKEASGGIVPTEAFEELYTLLKIGEKAEKKEGEEIPRKKAKTVEKSPQKNTLGKYFIKAGT